MYTSLPPKQGLYDPWFEHDACGLGVVANIKGRKSNKILRQALVVLRNMDHRGGQDADMNSGDGAGILLQLPHTFLSKNVPSLILSCRSRAIMQPASCSCRLTL
ncbi:MAG: glutamate synthase [Acidaminococcaceae bacterium]|nr:glutamate synthase [Acidaminococcaceae bacterium]